MLYLFSIISQVIGGDSKLSMGQFTTPTKAL